MIRETSIFSTWYAPLIAALAGRQQAFAFMKKHGIGTEALLQVDAIAAFDSVERALRAMPAHEFVETSGSASTWDCLQLVKDAELPLSGNFDDHNNDPRAYHAPNSTWQHRSYDHRGRNQQPLETTRQVVTEADALLEFEFGQWLNEPEVDGDYHEEVAQIAPLMRARGMQPIASAPGPYPSSILKGAHLAILKRWSLERTAGVVSEFLAFDRVLDEVYIAPGGTVFSEHEAQQLMIAVRRSIELRRLLVNIFIGDEGYTRRGPTWIGRALQTFVFAAGGLTPFGELLDRYLLGLEPDPHPYDHLAALAFGRILRRRDAIFQDRPRSPAYLARDEEYSRRVREFTDAIEGRLT